MAGLTLDTGALIGFERSERRTLLHLKTAHLRGYELTVPAAAIVEAWRGGRRSARIARLLGGCIVEPLFADLARLAGEAIGTVGNVAVVDAVVMASAAQRGDRVLTSDIDDLERLKSFFPGVCLLRA